MTHRKKSNFHRIITRAFIFALFLLIPFKIVAQQDSAQLVGKEIAPKKTLKYLSPYKASMYSAVLPGMGQIYNKKYWKAPVVWIGLAISGYYLWYNQTEYVKYKNAYRDFIIEDPANHSYDQIIDDAGLRPYYNDFIPGGKSAARFSSYLASTKSTYRTYRDYSIVAIGLIYALNIMNAAVDAHFSQFDISDDLTLNWVPICTPSRYNGTTFGVGVNLTFK